MNYFMEIVFNIIDIVLLLYLAWELTGRKKLDMKKVAMVISLQTIINMTVNIYFGTASFWGLIIMTLITGLLFNIVLETRIQRVYIGVLLGLTLIFFYEILSSAFILLFTNESPTVFFQDSLHRLVGATFSKILYIAITPQLLKGFKRLSRNNFSFFFDKKGVYYILLLSIINVVILFTAFVFYKYTFILKGHERIFIFGMVGSVIILTVLISMILWRIVDYTQREVEWKERENAYKKQLFYLNNMEEAMNSIRAQRHDFKNHISCIYGLLMLGKYREAFDYITKFTDEVVQYDVLLETGNSIITSLLNMKLIKARGENIKFETSIDLPKEIHLDMLDISIVLGNLLDNAIEACSHVSDGFIDLKIYEKEVYLIIKVINSKNSQVKVNLNQGRFTTKDKAKEDHGFGLFNIQQIVNKYDGILNIEDNVNTFNVSIAIPLINV